MRRAQAHFVECGGSTYPTRSWTSAVDEVLGDYPTLRTTTTQADPGLTHTTAISNVTELQAMENDLTGNYYLIGDIDATATSGWNGGSGFDPVGFNGSEFTGTFDGCGYTISNLYINRSGSRIGLFGEILDPAKIANVTLASVDITATQGYYAGALVGFCDAGSGASGDILIQNCHATGTITIAGATYSQVGGLIGYANGDDNTARCEIYDCSSTCSISTATTQFGEVGGLIGKCVDALIYNCYATGSITIPEGAYSIRVGGLIGYISDGTGENDGSQIEYCYATGNVTGTSAMGGFAGDTSGLGYIRKCYATGNVTAHDEGLSYGNKIGGFAGEASNQKEMTDCYAWGSVTIDENGYIAGGFIGQHATDCLITNCYSIGSVTPTDNENVGGFGGNTNATDITYSYWDTTSSGLDTSEGGTGHTTTWLKTNPNYPDSWDFDDIWYQTYTAPVDGYWTTRESPLSFLEGETVGILADGVVYPDQVVTDGEIDNTDFADATEVHIGLKYTSKLRPLKPLSHRAMMRKRATCKQMGISVHNTDDIKYGVHDDDMKDINFGEMKNKCDIDGLYTGTVAVSVPDGFSVNMPVQIMTDAPLPAVIRAMIPKVDVTGD